MTNLTKLMPSEIKQRYQTRDGQIITRAVIDGSAIYIEPSRSPSKYKLNSKGMLLNDREHSLDLVLKPEYRDEITDGERYRWLKRCSERSFSASIRYSLIPEAEIDEAILAERKPHIVRSWWVNHYKDGFSSIAYQNKDYSEAHEKHYGQANHWTHGPRTHVERRDVYSDDSVVVTREEC